ncbi:MAG: hypothetical protein V1740_01340 [Candidatus Woesearchaeota archaeon]
MTRTTIVNMCDNYVEVGSEEILDLLGREINDLESKVIISVYSENVLLRSGLLFASEIMGEYTDSLKHQLADIYLAYAMVSPEFLKKDLYAVRAVHMNPMVEPREEYCLSKNVSCASSRIDYIPIDLVYVPIKYVQLLPQHIDGIREIIERARESYSQHGGSDLAATELAYRILNPLSEINKRIKKMLGIGY